MNFGKALGLLVLEKRKVLGLTQMQLAEDAFGSTSKTRRISELESGSVANPHPKTIDPIIVTLGITENELSDCVKSANSKPDPDLDLAYQEAFELINDLAHKFDHSNPDATLEELEKFLSSKAREYLELRESISKLEAVDLEVEEIQRDALEALSKGQFSVVDELLVRAEEAQQDKQTLKQVRKQSHIRILRGDNRFLEGDMSEALELYKSAARFFEPFDELEMVDVLQKLAGRSYESGRRFLEPSFFVAQKLLKSALEAKILDENPKIRAHIHYRLSLIYRNEADSAPPDKSEELLNNAIEHARNAVKGLPDSEDSFERISSQISLGNCMSDKAVLTNTTDLLHSAIEVFEEVKLYLEKDIFSAQLLGHVCNSLGAAFLRKSVIQGEDIQSEILQKAKAAYTDATKASELSCDPEVWGVSQLNLGIILARESMIQTLNDEEAFFLRLRSIACFLAAIETYPDTLFPFPYAKAHSELAKVLFAHGLCDNTELAELYFTRAIASYLAASEIYSEDFDPMQWAHLQCGLGAIFGVHGDMDGVNSSQSDYEMAICYFEEGKRIFEKNQYDKGVSSCIENIKKLSKRLKSLKEKT